MVWREIQKQTNAIYLRRAKEIITVKHCKVEWLKGEMTCGSTTSCTKGGEIFSWRSFSGSPQCDAGGEKCFVHPLLELSPEGTSRQN